MLSMLVETYRARDLLWAMAEREIKIRYRRSVLGFLWSLLTPLYQVALLTIVVKYLWNNQTPNYSIKLLCALLPWTFFLQSILASCSSILNSRAMVRGVYFPRQILPLSVVASGLFHFCISMAVLVVILLIVPVAFSVTFLWLIPLTIIETVMISGIAMLVSALHTFFHDVEYIVTNLLSAFFFLTPVMWFLDWVPAKLHPWVMLNPMATICEGFRSVIIQQQPPPAADLVLTTAFAVLCFVVGALYYRAREWQFPEVI